ncbi:hypothetical protein MJO28_005352 [Puccinia striiformis f. sp. tritici]|uniref:Uncharacterized protein n=3 Tax=Puccinia striiformis TaxID=27350 RepID=A0A2S4W2Z6_9BASI|nr:hypothetical protein MJO28_005352 [Puccinia striiformis f. sp. tritici]KAI7960336.1 hypothetical protein MJO29_005404 [Puccinia striiformis f. sp. tritici]POW16153.1 hypothetical protein PSTT_01678 [Puccinia striiformis]POW22533.1 hypothetical protein PSHT_01189 [Puccinia striiformis]
MDNRAVEDLLSSFASDTFAVQSQPEKDLRASLINFFTVNHGPDGPNPRNGNANTSSPIPLANHTASNRSLPTGYQMSSTYQGDELPPPNTPIGSPMKEDIFDFAVATPNNASSPENYPTTPSPTNHTAQPPRNHDSTHTHVDSFGNCLSCANSAAFHQGYPHFPHAPSCHFDQFNTNLVQSLQSQNSELSSAQIPTQAHDEQTSQFKRMY